MRLLLIILGVLFVLVGGVWILQGTYVLTQGFMAGDMKWTYIGIGAAAVGVLLLVLGVTRRRRS